MGEVAFSFFSAALDLWRRAPLEYFLYNDGSTYTGSVKFEVQCFLERWMPCAVGVHVWVVRSYTWGSNYGNNR